MKAIKYKTRMSRFGLAMRPSGEVAGVAGGRRGRIKFMATLIILSMFAKSFCWRRQRQEKRRALSLCCVGTLLIDIILIGDNGGRGGRGRGSGNLHHAMPAA